MNSPDEVFDAYLEEAGVNGEELAKSSSRAIESALQRHHEALASAAILDNLPVAKQREIAAVLGVPRSVITAFRERKVIAASIPRLFMRRFAATLGGSVKALLECLALPSGGQLAHSYKSETKPNTQLQATFEQLLIDAQVPPEKRAELMRDED
ncbi:hypothetical protein ACQUKI_07555 [Ralstonia pseudosolanacearum]